MQFRFFEAFGFVSVGYIAKVELIFFLAVLTCEKSGLGLGIQLVP